MLAISGNAYVGQKGPNDLDNLKKPTSTHVEVDSTASEVNSEVLRAEFKDATSFQVETDSTASEVVLEAVLEDLEKILAGMALRDEPADKEIDRATQLVQAYCFQNEPQFQRVMVYRDRVSHFFTICFQFKTYD